MQILIIPNTKKSSAGFTLRPWSLFVVASVLSVLTGSVFYSGYQYANSQTEVIISNIRSQTSSRWEDDIEQQRNTLREIKTETEKSLEAMAGRLSLLQGHVMRLDALGSRLASMAELDDIQFGIDNPPGMGGPVPTRLNASPDVTELLSSLDELEERLSDRSEKLAVMESMLINRTLQEKTSPGGRPADGGWISSLFGYRTDPMTGKKEFHEGMDFAGKPDTPVTAAAAGIVTWSGPRYGYGNMIEVSHGSGYITRYAHNRKNLVSVGEKVEKSEIIGLMGSSGRSTGTHLHFEVLRYGRHVDPRKYLSLN
ncbi:MAG: M23 family metallopeptidase [Gammaproteobacteria bacterium]